MTIEQELITAVDRAAKKLRTTRSAFTRQALRLALARLKEIELEQQHRAGYRRHPSRKGETSIWESEQKWPD